MSVSKYQTFPAELDFYILLLQYKGGIAIMSLLFSEVRKRNTNGGSHESFR